MDTDTETEFMPLTPPVAELAFRSALHSNHCKPVGQIDGDINSMDLDFPEWVLLVPAVGFAGVAQYATPAGLVLVALVGGPWACLAYYGATSLIRLNPQMTKG